MEARGVRGWATSFAPLTSLGRLQIDTIASDYRLQEAEGILCSSYARALESAARLSRVLNKPLYVEYDLHEWLPQKDSLANIDQQLLDVANEQLRREMHQAPGPEDMPWESLEQVRRRVTTVLKRYQHLEKVIVVSHAVVISSLVGLERLVDHAEIVEFDLEFDGEPAASRSQPRLETW